MKKLLYIGNKLSAHGNTATSIETLGSCLEEEGYSVVYASCKLNKVVRIIHMIYKTFTNFRKVDGVLIDTYSTQNFWFAFIISQLCRVLRLKYITKLHGGNLPYRLENNPFFCDLIFKNAYKITAPSNYLLNAFKVKYSDNLVFIPNTLELKNYRFENRITTIPKLLWVRSFSSIYNPRMAIDVLHFLKQHYKEATLCMVGPDKENLIDACEKYAEELNVSVTFTGKLSKQDWIKLSNNYNIFINTTHFDNTPVSLLEAMALGLPVISTNVGGIPYMITNAVDGILVEDNNAKAMSDAIVNLIENPEIRNEIVINARKKVVLFDWELVKYEWFKLLH